MPKLVDHDQRRDQVAAVAAGVLANSGIESSTIRDVATAGGWSTTMVTHYFSNKDQLLLHTLAMSVADMASSIDEAHRTGSDELRAIIEAILPLDEERRSRWRLWLAFWGRAIGSDELAAIQRNRQLQLVDRIAMALAQRGEATDDAERLFEAENVAALIDGVSVQAVFAPEKWPVSRQLAHFDDLLGPWSPPPG